MYCNKKSGATMLVMSNSASGFGNNLKSARDEANLSQLDVTERLAERGFTVLQSSLSHYETGRRFPDPPLLAALAQVLEVSADYLLGLTKITSPVSEILEDLEAASGEAKINKVMRKLSRDNQNQVVTFAEYLLDQEKKTEKPAELSEWIAATEVLMRRHGTEGEGSFVALFSSERPDLAAALGILTKQKSVQDG